MEIFEYIFKVKSLASQVISLVKGFSIRSGKESKKANSFESNIRIQKKGRKKKPKPLWFLK
ncbi:unnamed protein product [Larinioides sclopetarius]|uniref:Ribosomal protein L32 n=1 Tax=Larinioides sclopetarius TaxID=280406 RepID=A0AAV1YX10_9ARAC